MRKRSTRSEPQPWDWPPRGRRPPPPLEGEILLEEEPTPRRIETVEILPPRQPEHHVRVDVHHHRQRQHMPRLAIALLIIAAVMWISPLGVIIALVLIAAVLMMHPAVAIILAAWLALMIVIAIRARLKGRPF
jgi:hypothetical protein